jgi:membrane-bound lytic murein transglycosylase B
MNDLRNDLMENGVPGTWFDKQIRNETFQLHANIGEYFQRAGECQTVPNKKTRPSRKRGAHSRVAKGEAFIKKNHGVLKRAEARHGIHKELIAAIIGIETNFADHKYQGNFYAFNSLVSQYIFTNREDFAVREITALYQLSRKTGQSMQYLKSSYAGAIGWGQFIPSSLLAYFVKKNGKKHCLNPFSIEDTVLSVENYLYKHQLSKANINDEDSRYEAVYAYNHSDDYVEAVLSIYDQLRNRFSKAKHNVSEES